MNKSIDKNQIFADINAILPQLTHLEELDKRGHILNAVYQMNGWKEGDKGKNKQGMCYIHVVLDQIIKSLITEDILSRPGYGRLAFTEKGLQHYGSDQVRVTPRIKDDSALSPLEVPLPEPEKVVIDTVSVFVPDLTEQMSQAHLEQSQKAVPCFGKYSPSESGCLSCLLRMACFNRVLEGLSKRAVPPSKRGEAQLNDEDWMMGVCKDATPCTRCGKMINKGETASLPKRELEAGMYHPGCRS